MGLGFGRSASRSYFTDAPRHGSALQTAPLRAGQPLPYSSPGPLATMLRNLDKAGRR